MTLKDAFKEHLSFPKIREWVLQNNPEIPKQTKYPGEWLEKHNPGKFNKMYREWLE